MMYHGHGHPPMSQRKGSLTSPSTLFASGEQGWWLCPWDMSTLYQDTAGTVPVTSLGQTVARISDMSGGGNHFTQATVGNRGVYSLDAYGRPGVYFNGTNTFYSAPSLAFGSPELTMWVGAAATGGAGQGVIHELGTNSSTQNGSWGLLHPVNFSTARCSLRSRGTALISMNSAGAGTIRRRVFTLTSSIATPLLTIQGELDDFTSNSGTQGTGNFLTHVPYLGARAGRSSFYTGHIHEVVVRAAATATALRAEITNYVNSHTGAY